MPRKSQKNSRVTLAQVADKAKVSAITVSRVLRQPELVSEDVRARVIEAIETLNYVPDPAASALASKRTNIIGVLIPSVTNNVFSAVLAGIYDAIEGTQLTVQLGNTRYKIGEEEKLVRIFRSQKPAGLVVAGIDQSAATRAMLSELDCPVVQVMDISAEPIDMMVGFSHRNAAATATRHLIESGYRRIGFLGARMDPRTQRRFDGYRDAMISAGLWDERLAVTTVAASSITLGGQMVADLWSAAPDADAVFCNNDDIALGVLFECDRRRIAVPDGFGICGFNDFEMMAAAYPPLSSVRTHRYEMGRKAIELIVATLDGRRPATPVVDLGFDLMVRESSGGPRKR